MYDLINVGAAPNDGTGDPLRKVFIKLNKIITDLNGGSGTFKTVNSNYTAEAGQVIFVDATLNTVDITLPANPVLGDTVEVIVVAGTFAVTLGTQSGARLRQTYVDSTVGWVIR
jgi:hypothetical protein